LISYDDFYFFTMALTKSSRRGKYDRLFLSVKRSVEKNAMPCPTLVVNTTIGVNKDFKLFFVNITEALLTTCSNAFDLMIEKNKIFFDDEEIDPLMFNNRVSGMSLHILVAFCDLACRIIGSSASVRDSLQSASSVVANYGAYKEMLISITTLIAEQDENTSSFDQLNVVERVDKKVVEFFDNLFIWLRCMKNIIYDSTFWADLTTLNLTDDCILIDQKLDEVLELHKKVRGASWDAPTARMVKRVGVKFDEFVHRRQIYFAMSRMRCSKTYLRFVGQGSGLVESFVSRFTRHTDSVERCLQQYCFDLFGSFCGVIATTLQSAVANSQNLTLFHRQSTLKAVIPFCDFVIAEVYLLVNVNEAMGWDVETDIINQINATFENIKGAIGDNDLTTNDMQAILPADLVNFANTLASIMVLVMFGTITSNVLVVDLASECKGALGYLMENYRPVMQKLSTTMATGTIIALENKLLPRCLQDLQAVNVDVVRHLDPESDTLPNGNDDDDGVQQVIDVLSQHFPSTPTRSGEEVDTSVSPLAHTLNVFQHELSPQRGNGTFTMTSTEHGKVKEEERPNRHLRFDEMETSSTSDDLTEFDRINHDKVLEMVRLAQQTLAPEDMPKVEWRDDDALPGLRLMKAAFENGVANSDNATEKQRYSRVRAFFNQRLTKIRGSTALPNPLPIEGAGAGGAGAGGFHGAFQDGMDIEQ
jgi:hypothetical protein